MRAIALVILTMLLSLPGFAQKHRSHSSSTQTHTSKKSTAAGSHDGHYENGRGSSHKGGHYKNSTTHDHYRKHKK
jgi:hypothetical protein